MNITKKFVPIDDSDKISTYRITFECTREEYEIIVEEIHRGANEMIAEEIEIEI